VPAGKGVGVRAYGGLEVGFKVGCSSDEGVGLVCDGVNGTVWSIPLGILVGKTTQSGMFIGGDIRYSFTLSDTFENVPDVRNRTWYLRLVLGKGRAN
jgi:hypothetical protein